MDTELAIAAAQAGALGSLPCAMLSPEKARDHVNIFRQQVTAPVSMNFFAHTPTVPDPAREAAWRGKLAPYYREMQLDPAMPIPAAARAPVDSAM
jgi:nitronate monooxygenase